MSNGSKLPNEADHREFLWFRYPEYPNELAEMIGERLAPFEICWAKKH